MKDLSKRNVNVINTLEVIQVAESFYWDLPSLSSVILLCLQNQLNHALPEFSSCKLCKPGEDKSTNCSEELTNHHQDPQSSFPLQTKDDNPTFLFLQNAEKKTFWGLKMLSLIYYTKLGEKLVLQTNRIHGAGAAGEKLSLPTIHFHTS